MRIWDVDPSRLCRQHLPGEHRELHGLWNILTKHGGVGGYSKHPETQRWIGKLAALHKRHQKLVDEMTRRGYCHAYPLRDDLVSGSADQTTFINSVREQENILRKKGCDCLGVL